MMSPRRPSDAEDLEHLPCISADGAMLAPNWHFRQPDSERMIEVPIMPRLLTQAEAAVEAAIRASATCACAITTLCMSRAARCHPGCRFLDLAAPRLRRSLASINSVN
jgi:hypothetical protein